MKIEYRKIKNMVKQLKLNKRGKIQKKKKMMIQLLLFKK